MLFIKKMLLIIKICILLTDDVWILEGPSDNN